MPYNGANISVYKVQVRSPIEMIVHYVLHTYVLLNANDLDGHFP